MFSPSGSGDENSNLFGVGCLFESPRAKRRDFKDSGELSSPLRLMSGTVCVCVCVWGGGGGGGGEGLD